MMTKEGSNKIANSMTPSALVLVSGRGHMSYDESTFFSSSLLPGINRTNLLYSHHDQGRVYQNYQFHDPPGQWFLFGGMTI